ncbi:ectonucleoside triphosphate diphosphohydrolase 6 isoform 3-T9 [Spinachia spinachia]
MKRPKLAGVLILLGGLLAYLMFVKRHYGASEPDAYRPPPAPRLAAGGPVSPGRNSQYGIMFDAGSTGTRIHVFEFQMERNEAPKLAHETFRAIEPGLSAYADYPEEGAAGLMELLKVAESTVPPSSWTLTPVVLKATAGLRLLDGEKAKQLLDMVRALFTDSPFLSRDDSVSIMDGTDEVTCGSLSGDLHSPDSSTAGMLDLGGGSTQITFSPQEEKTIQTSPMDYIRSFRMFNSTHTVYTHSYLGLGLMSARLSVLGGIEAPPRGSSTELVSPCLAPESSGSWEHADLVYRVRGQKESRSTRRVGPKWRRFYTGRWSLCSRQWTWTSTPSRTTTTGPWTSGSLGRRREEPFEWSTTWKQPNECAAVPPSVLCRVRSSAWTWSTFQSCCRSSASPPTNSSSWRGPSIRWKPVGLWEQLFITSSPCRH